MAHRDDLRNLILNQYDEWAEGCGHDEDRIVDALLANRDVVLRALEATTPVVSDIWKEHVVALIRAADSRFDTGDPEAWYAARHDAVMDLGGSI